MSENLQLAWVDVSGGMNSAVPAHKIADNQVARMVNCALVDQLPRTRHRIRVVPLTGEVAAVLKANNVQGSIYFNPSQGQGAFLLGQNSANLAVACGGRKYIVKLNGGQLTRVGEVTEITNGLLTNSQLHLNWLLQAENYLLSQDGQSNCFIWDAANPARFSKGYNTIDKPSSEIPNGGTVMLYVDARVSGATNNRFILYGDSLHESSLTTASNLPKFTSQTYWATGQYFAPPSMMGEVLAAAVLPIRDDSNGQGAGMYHCANGVFSINTNIYPRSRWAEEALVRHTAHGAAAVGPYAIDVHDMDQIYRTRNGIKTLRSARAESNLEGNPQQPISNAVRVWLDSDFPAWRKFTSLVLAEERNRMFCTVQPQVRGRFRWNFGCVVRNTDPAIDQSETPAAWEGLWTLPSQVAGITQFVRGMVDGEQCVFAWCVGTDGVTRLVEFLNDEGDDILEDGSTQQVRGQIISRVIDLGKWWKEKQYSYGKLYLTDVIGTVKWGVWVRPKGSRTWTKWQTGSVTVPDMDGETLEQGEPSDEPIVLGEIPDRCAQGARTRDNTGLQLLIRFEGVCTVEGVYVGVEENAVDQNKFDKSRLAIERDVITASDYDDFEYWSEPNPWTQEVA